MAHTVLHRDVADTSTAKVVTALGELVCQKWHGSKSNTGVFYYFIYMRL